MEERSGSTSAGRSRAAYPGRGELAQAIASEWDELVASTLELAASSLAVRWCALFLFQGSRRRLTLARLWTRGKGLASRPRQNATSDITLRVIEDGEPLAAVRTTGEWLGTRRDGMAEELCPGVCVPIDLGGERLGAVSLVRGPRDSAFRPDEVKLAVTVSRQIAVSLRNSVLHQRANELANTDGLTGLLNYRCFQQRLELEVERASRYRRPLSLVMLDIDNLKKYNDQYGHPQADLALRQLALTVRIAVRRVDIVARCGGDEFAVILPETDGPQALLAANRIALAVGDQPKIATPGGTTTEGLSVSIGISSFPTPAVTKEDLVRQADASLYRAKTGGAEHVWLWEAGPQGATIPQQPVY